MSKQRICIACKQHNHRKRTASFITGPYSVYTFVTASSCTIVAHAPARIFIVGTGRAPVSSLTITPTHRRSDYEDHQCVQFAARIFQRRALRRFLQQLHSQHPQRALGRSRPCIRKARQDHSAKASLSRSGSLRPKVVRVQTHSNSGQSLRQL